MNGYIALKNTVFNGIGYTAGSIVPAEAVLPSRLPVLLRNGTLAKASETIAEDAETPQNEPKEVEGITTFPLQTENGVLGLLVSCESIIEAVTILQKTAEDAIADIAAVESEDTLLIIDACDSRKSVKKAAKERATALQEEAEGNGDE